MKGLKLWQIVMLVVVTLGVAGGVYGIYNWVAGPSTTTLPENIQLVRVQYGSIVNSVSASGSVGFPVKEQLTFGIAGTVQEVSVQEGAIVEQGQVLAKFDSASTISLQKAVTQSRINLRNAEEALAKAEDPYTELDILQAKAAVTNAKVALEAAQEALEKAENPYTEVDIVKAELDVVNAEIALRKAQENYERATERLDRNPTVPEWVQDYKQKRVQLAIAEFDLAEAEETLAEMKAGAEPLQVEQKQRQLAVAQTSLKKAEDDLADMLGSVDSLEVELKRLEVASAQAALDEAVKRLEMDTIVAPFAGIVTSVNVEAGEAVNASTVVIELLDPSVVEVSAILDEIDVAQVKLGQRVSVSIDALPDLELTGEVSTISAVARAQSGVVTYPVTITVTVPSGARVMEGMSATASIIIQEVNNVLLIPNQAISGSLNNPMVNVMTNGETTVRAVRLGISDGVWTEVVEGLQEGEVVMVEVTATSTQQQFRGGMMPGGGTFFQMR